MVFSSPIFRKLLGSALIVIAFTLFALDFYLTRYTSQHEVQQVEQRLTTVARVLSAESTNLPPARMEDWAKSASERGQCRVTVIGPDGVVLADSDQDPESMENHANRPEVLAAYQNRTGSAIRRSRTLGRDLCYLAIPFQYQGRSGYVLRMALPLENLDHTIAAVRSRILIASLIAAFVALLFAYFFSRSFTHRINRLRSFAEGLVNAQFSESLLADAPDELGRPKPLPQPDGFAVR